MTHDPTAVPEIVRPLSGEIEEAKRIPGGWVYRIAGKLLLDLPVVRKT